MHTVPKVSLLLQIQQLSLLMRMVMPDQEVSNCKLLLPDVRRPCTELLPWLQSLLTLWCSLDHLQTMPIRLLSRQI